MLLPTLPYHGSMPFFFTSGRAASDDMNFASTLAASRLFGSQQF
jgi:hypothetical protein